MQDVQNIPNPDVNSTESNDDFGSHSEVEQNPDRSDIGGEDESIPVPPDRQPSAPVEEPPGTSEPPIGEDENQPEQFV